MCQRLCFFEGSLVPARGLRVPQYIRLQSRIGGRSIKLLQKAGITSIPQYLSLGDTGAEVRTALTLQASLGPLAPGSGLSIPCSAHARITGHSVCPCILLFQTSVRLYAWPRALVLGRYRGAEVRTALSALLSWPASEAVNIPKLANGIVRALPARATAHLATARAWVPEPFTRF